MAKTNKQINKEATTTQDTTLAVVDYRMGQLETAVKEGFATHDKKLDGLTMNFASSSDVVALQARVASLESDRKWIVRLVIGAVVFSMLALIGIGFKLHGA